MPTLPATTRAAMAIAIAGVTASLLTGCFANPVEELVNRSVEGAVEEATGGDVSLSGELPADFPAEVPVIEGKIGLSAGDALAEAAAELEAAGYTEDTAVSGGQVGAKVYTGADYLVLLAGEGSTVSYTVTPKVQ
jgi:nucleotide-binding universal stress UspA family protein